MRNIKRVLSLALASVMLLGMMVVGSSAAFNDADKIVNTKAATVTAGLGLFAGTTDGNFDPTGTVTRAQMATVISKMIYGSDVNADSFKGQGKFSDTASFEGGWAEGYINLCVNLGVVAGYGDGTFKPGNAVTTAEAVTMLINALKVDAGEGQWPMTVMAAAETIKLFTLEEELATKPGTNNALTRDELSVMVLNALYYSPEGGNAYIFDGVKFDNATDAYIASNFGQNGDVEVVPAQDTLASETFEIQTATGWVTANQATGAECTTVAGVDVDLETGLDMIGHYVTVYYAEEYESEDEPGIAYCIADEAKYITVAEEIEANDTKAFKAAFGSKNLTTNAPEWGAETDDEYNVDDYTGVDADDYTCAEYDFDNKAAAAGTYIVFEGKLVGYIAPAAKSVVEITKVVTTAGKEKISIDGRSYNNNETEDVVVEYEGIAQDDIAIMVQAQNMKFLTKADKFDGKVTRTGTNAKEQETLTIDGKVYVIDAYDTSVDGLLAAKGDVDFNYTYTFYTDNGNIVAFEELEGSTDLGDIVYAVGAYTTTTVDAYGNEIESAYAQIVDLEGKESALLIGIKYDSAELDDLGVYADDEDWAKEDFVAGFTVFEQSKKNSDEKKAGIMVVDADAIAEAPEAGKATIFADEITDEFNSKTNKYSVGDSLAFVADTTKYILIDGAPGKTLDVAVKTGSVNLASDTYKVILSSDKSGNVTIEVVVYIADELVLPSADLIYVSAAQIAAQGTVAEATEIEVYFVATGKTETINIEDTFVDEEGDIDTSLAGFYSYNFDAAEGVYTDLVKQNTVMDGDEIHEDNQIFYSEILKNVYGGKMLITENIEGLDASAALVIDVRSEKDLEKSEFDVVESLADLKGLVAEDIEVTLDVMLDDNDQETVVAIFVIDVQEIEEV